MADGGIALGSGDAGPAQAAMDAAMRAGDGICTRCGACEQTVTFSGGSHVVGTIDYPDRPPAGGDHNECWGTFGVHDTALDPERWVHNLEHGGVAFLYACPSGCSSDVATLSALVGGKGQALLTPYADMPTRFAVVSWGHRLKSNCLDAAAFEAFYKAHVDDAPESITSAPPAGCPN
jgi:hypothetical protein